MLYYIQQKGGHCQYFIRLLKYHFLNCPFLKMDQEEQGPIDMEIQEDPANPQAIKAITSMMNYLTTKDFQELTFEQIKDLSSATQRTHEQCQQVVNQGGISLFIGLLESKDHNILQEGFHALGNIATDSAIYRSRIIKQGGLQKLVATTKSINDNLQLFQIGIWAIAMVCRVNEQEGVKFYEVSHAIQFLSQCIAQNIIEDENTLTHSLDVIQGFIDYNAGSLGLLIKTNLVPRLFQLLDHSNLTVVSNSLAIIGNITTGTNEQTDQLIKNGIVGKIYPFMNNPTPKIRKQVCWIYSNISAGTQQQIQRLLQHSDLIQNLFTLFENDQLKVGYEICYIFANLTNNGHKNKIMQLFLDKSICSYYIKFLFKCQAEKDYHIMNICLQTLVSILQFGQKYKSYEINGQNSLIKQLLPFKSDILTFLSKIDNQNLQTDIKGLLRQFQSQIMIN